MHCMHADPRVTTPPFTYHRADRSAIAVPSNPSTSGSNPGSIIPPVPAPIPPPPPPAAPPPSSPSAPSRFLPPGTTSSSFRGTSSKGSTMGTGPNISPDISGFRVRTAQGAFRASIAQTRVQNRANTGYVVVMSDSTGGKYGRVFDGHSFQDVLPPPGAADGGGGGAAVRGHRPRPVPPAPAGGGPAKAAIFVSIPQFRDGRRCARTLRRLFASASHPDRVFVGLIEQTDAERPKEDPTCLDEYCALLGHAPSGAIGEGIEHEAERRAERDRIREGCPRVKDQIRSVRFHHLAAKGPVYARSFVRKVLGDEEFCMQIDAATDFDPGWDELAIRQWATTGNEYAILSTEPPSSKEREKGASNGSEVPRQCNIKIGSEGVPLYENVADGKAIGLRQPLLSTTHSSSFAFGKCHYETNVPHDPFAAQLLASEKFPRFARLWTRGYDVYTPSVNIVYRDNSILHPLHHAAGHGGAEGGEGKKWPRNDNERRDAYVRMKVLLDIHHGISGAAAASLGGGAEGGIGGKISAARANLGIYGLGKRRTLEQLLDFVGIALPGPDFSGQHGNDGRGCANPAWVPYDASVSPRANLFDGTGKADDLDLDPEFPLRTLPDATGGQYDHPFAMGNAAWDEMTNSESEMGGVMEDGSSDVPYSMVFLLWVVGLFVWFSMFVRNDGKAEAEGGRLARTPRISPRKPRRKFPLSERALKNV
ncbi:hypothetical protein ACHAWF_005943 [Thalassiosira exigua]